MVMVVADVVMAAAMTAVCGLSFFFAAAADGAITDAAVAVMDAAAADADICSFFHFEWGRRFFRMPLLAYLFK